MSFYVSLAKDKARGGEGRVPLLHKKSSSVNAEQDAIIIVAVNTVNSLWTDLLRFANFFGHTWKGCSCDT